MNVGPTGDGVFQPAAIRRLREIGAWMDVNGTAIHGVRPAPVEEPEWGRLTLRRNADGAPETLHVFLTNKDIGGEVDFVFPEGNPVAALVIETAEDVAMRRDADGRITLRLPKHLPDERITVIAIRFE